MSIFKNFKLNILYLFGFILVGASVLYPRLILLGGYPATDEGVYLYFSQIMYHSIAYDSTLSQSLPIALYPTLISWIFSFDFNHLFLARFIDALVATAVGYLLFFLIYTKIKHFWISVLISSIFLFSLNQTMFIQYGFKNTFFMALIPALIGVLVAQNNNISNTYKWYYVGILLSASVLFRETFIVFGVMGFIAIYFYAGYKNAIRYAVSATVFGFIIILLLMELRNSVSLYDLIERYSSMGTIYKNVESRVLTNFLTFGAKSSIEMGVPLLIAFLSLLISFYYSYLKLFSKNKEVLFWIIVALCPLVEPFTKLGFAYHFSLVLVGMSVLSAIIINEIRLISKKIFFILIVFILTITSYTYVPKFNSLNSFYSLITKYTINLSNSAEWSKNLIDKSYYLLWADIIKKNSKKGDTLCMSGYMNNIYPLTGLLPPSDNLSNLNREATRLNFDPVKLSHSIRKQSPTFIFVTGRKFLPGTDTIEKSMDYLPEYKKIAYLKKNKKIDYGNFNGVLYMLID